MSDDKPFQPEFGPNGAVLNAPTMTPEMRAKFDAIGKIPPRSELLAWVGFFAFLGLGVVVVGWLRALMRESPWWAGAISGAVAAVSVSVLWRAARQSLSRWEIMGGKIRLLTAPLWVRLFLFATDFLGTAVYVGTFVAVVANPDIGGAEILLAMYLLVFGIKSLNAFLTRLAERRGWIVNPAPNVPLSATRAS